MNTDDKGDNEQDAPHPETLPPEQATAPPPDDAESKLSFSRVMSFVIFGFILFALFRHIATDPTLQTETTETNDQPSTFLSNELFSGFDTKLGDLIPMVSPTLIVEELETGTGEKVHCGQEVSLWYSAYMPDGQLYETNRTQDEPTLLRTGMGAIPRAVELGAIGMRSGGQRKVTAPAVWAYAPSKKEGAPREMNMNFTITVNDVSPKMMTTEVPMRQFIKYNGTGATTRCGDVVEMELTLSDVRGKELYNSKAAESSGTLRFQVGLGQVMRGLEVAALETLGSSEVTYLIPPALQQPFHPSNDEAINQEPPALTSITLPENEMIIADIKRIPVNENRLGSLLNNWQVITGAGRGGRSTKATDTDNQSPSTPKSTQSSSEADEDPVSSDNENKPNQD